MMKKTALVLAVIASILVFSGPAAATVLFPEEFDHGLSPYLTPSIAPGYSYQITGGQLFFEKSAYDPDQAVLFTNFQIIGDFSITTRPTWIQCNPQQGQGGYAELQAQFWNNNTGAFALARIGAEASPDSEFIHGAFMGSAISSSSSMSNAFAWQTVTLKLERVDTTVNQYYDFGDGNGFHLIASRTNEIFSNPAMAWLALDTSADSLGGGDPTLLKASFDNFIIVADGLDPNPSAVPLPPSLGLLATGLIPLWWRRRSQGRRN